MGKTNEITRLLIQSRNGDEGSLSEVFPLVYNELKQIAGRYMRKENPGHTLQPTALVHEAAVRVFQGAEVQWQDRNHFFAVASSVMRRILIDHAKAKKAAKRGGNNIKVSFDEKIHAGIDDQPDLIELDDALKKLGALNERQAKVVELRYFGGLGVEECAEVLSVSPATIKRDWNLAKLWLYHELGSKKENI